MLTKKYERMPCVAWQTSMIQVLAIFCWKSPATTPAVIRAMKLWMSWKIGSSSSWHSTRLLSSNSDLHGGERIIHMNQSSHTGATDSVQGHSIGRWEGSTLVIDTAHFSVNNFGNGFGLPSGPQKQLIEKLILSDDGKTISYQFVLTDPEYLSAAMTLESEWSYQPNYNFIVDDCDLESARRFLLN